MGVQGDVFRHAHIVIEPFVTQISHILTQPAYHYLARFVADVGVPAKVRFIVDEAHNLCNEQWPSLLAKYCAEL